MLSEIPYSRLEERQWLLTIAITLLFITISAYGAEIRRDEKSWSSYLGNSGRTQYSALDQINVQNVDQLQIAWRFDTGDAQKSSQIQCNPIIVNDVLYATSPKLKVFALKAATGELDWQYDPFKGQTSGQGINRGVMYWSHDDDRRILFTAGRYLYALNADSGKLISSFGKAGKVDLRTGLGRNRDELQVNANTPGAIYQDLVIMGSTVGETPGAAPGHIRAFNIYTGGLAWIFHTIPHHGEYAYDTWSPDSWLNVGGANSWGGMSLDQDRGIVFVPTGSPSYDFYGANRIGDNLFANSVIALDAKTGTRIWHFQTVHHDLWDRDLPSPPVLITLNRNNKQVNGVAQVTKSGFVFVFDRLTGAPLFPVVERPVPRSDVEGEITAKTQPFPVKPPPFTRQHFTSNDLTDISEASRNYAFAQLQNVRTGKAFIPPSDKQATIMFPGFDGGAEWGGAAFDPENGHLYVNATELPWTYKLIKISTDAGDPGKIIYQKYCAGCHGLDRKGNGKDFPSLIGIGQRLSQRKIGNLIRDGSGRMSGFPQLGFEKILLLMDYVNVSETEEREVQKSVQVSRKESKVMYLHTGYIPFYDQDGYPAIKPPWGTLTSIDLNKGEISWQIPLGEYPELVKKGIRGTGTENYGGPVVTKGGIIFIAATMDKKFRAFNKASGKLLWEADLPASGFATPSTYAVNGKQFVVIAAGGGKSGRISSGEYIAFSLPD